MTPTTAASQTRAPDDQPQHRPPSPNGVLPMGCAAPRNKSMLLGEMSHGYIERRRRQDMGRLLGTLRALLPTALKSQRRRQSQCTILTETMKYIATLQDQLKELRQKKADLVASKGASMTCAHNKLTDDSNALTGRKDPCSLLLASNKTLPLKAEGWSKVEVSRAERDIFITISASACASLLSKALLCVQNLNLNVLNACLSTNAELRFLSIHSQPASCADQLDIGRLRDELDELVTGEVRASDHNESHAEDFSKAESVDQTLQQECRPMERRCWI